MATARKTIVNICRVLLALTFIFSGYVKAIDPLGTLYKLQDYQEAVGLTGGVPDWALLVVAVLLAALEFCLGMFLLFAIRRRQGSRLMVAFMVVMTAITVWLAVANPIKDCGCFGDAIHLSNSQTLLKNIVLLACSIIVAWKPLDMFRFVSKSTQWIVINYTILFILISSGHSLYHLPQFDFRPYHIGADLRQGMAIPADAPKPEFNTTFILEKNGVRKEFTLDNYPDSPWTFVESKTVQTRAGYEPPIHDFSIEETSTGEDITERLLQRKGYTFLLISPHLEHADDAHFGEINEIFDLTDNGKRYPFFCLTASGKQGIERWIDLTGAEYPFCTTDETTLKTIIRSNPGLVLLKDGRVVNKWSHNDLDNVVAQLKDANGNLIPLEDSKLGQTPADNVPMKILHVVLWFALPLFLLTLADRLWAWTRWLKRKEQSNKIYQLLNRKK